MVPRLLILSLVFLLSAGYVSYASRAEDVALREPLTRLPNSIGSWHGREMQRFSAAIERELGADEYITRSYSRGTDPSVALYVGYYRSQRQGDTIHSPMNCLPGAGWQPVQFDRIDVPLKDSGNSINVNRYVIEKGVERQVVLYWYQSHGRVIASEYWSKAFMVYDAIRLNRTDAALVRVISPVAGSEPDDLPAGRRVVEFVQELFPSLRLYLPS